MCPNGLCPVITFSGRMCRFHDFACTCPVQGAEVHFAAISQDFWALQEWFLEASSRVKAVQVELEGPPWVA